MRILQVTPHYFPELKFGGPPEKIHALSRGLATLGYQIEVITFHSEDRWLATRQSVEGIPVQYLRWIGSGTRQIPLSVSRLSHAIAEADVVHCHGLYNLLCPCAARCARQQLRPFVIEPLGMYWPRARNVLAKRIYHRLFTRRMFRQASCVIATSTAEADELGGAIEKGRLVLRRNGIDVLRFQNLPPRELARQQLDLPPEAKVILYLGRISPIKNLEELIHAFAALELVEARLLLVGPMLEPNYTRQLLSLITSLGVEQKVVLTGPRFAADKLGVLSAADLFVLPSLSESYGNAAAEAVAARLPVLLTEGCGIAPTIHQRAGLAVSCDRSGLFHGLCTLLNDQQREALTRQRAEVLKELSWEQPLALMDSLYKKIARGGEPMDGGWRNPKSEARPGRTGE